MNNILFGTAIALEAIYILLFILTIKLPGFRFWPPPSWRSWQFWLAWLMVAIVAVNGLLLGLRDFDSAFLPDLTQRGPIALILIVLGSGLGSWAALTFGMRATLGLGEQLVTSGPYRFTRNPQYIGDGLNILAFMILANSWMVWGIGLLALLLTFLAPFTEEPWLAVRFGERYLAYQRRVPRFFGKVKEEQGKWA